MLKVQHSQVNRQKCGLYKQIPVHVCIIIAHKHKKREWAFRELDSFVSTHTYTHKMGDLLIYHCWWHMLVYRVHSGLCTGTCWAASQPRRASFHNGADQCSVCLLFFRLCWLKLFQVQLERNQDTGEMTYQCKNSYWQTSFALRIVTFSARFEPE